MDHEQDTHPQIYLITPRKFDRDTFAEKLAQCLDTTPVACVRLSLATSDQSDIIKTADQLRTLTHAHDIALVIDEHVQLAEQLGLDGVHLNYSPAAIKNARATLGEEAIVGAYCKQSRHDGMTAGELGADYVSFGPIGESLLGDGVRVERELFEWWSRMIEVPVVAEGVLTPDSIKTFAPHTDFIALGDELWSTEDPAATLSAIHSILKN